MKIKTIWNRLVPGKVNLLVWRTKLRLLTQTNLLYIGVNILSDLCPLCNMQQETEEQVFLEATNKTHNVADSFLKRWQVTVLLIHNTIESLF